jgi:hypothetical protein
VTGRSPSGRAAAATQSNPQAVSSKADIPSAYEARVLSAHLPNHTIAFSFAPDGSVPFCGGIFRIEYLRPATAEDEARFPWPNDDSVDEICPLCNRAEEWL